MPQLGKDLAASLVDGIGNQAPTDNLLITVDARRVRVTLSIGANNGRLGDDESYAGSAGIVV